MMMTKIDPYNITNFQRSDAELELFLLFCIVVAGKTAYIQSEKLDLFLGKTNVADIIFDLFTDKFNTSPLLNNHIINFIFIIIICKGGIN